MYDKGISRRDFIKSTAFSVAAIAQFGAQPQKKGQTKLMKTKQQKDGFEIRREKLIDVLNGLSRV